MTVVFRPAVSEDFDFLYPLNRTTMREYVVKTWGSWNESWQRKYYRQHFRPAACKVIVCEGQDVGVLPTGRTERDFFIARIQLLPMFQGRGIGTALINTILGEAHDSGMPVTLHVLRVNNRAQRLYKRLGFSIVEETRTHYLMKATPRGHPDEDTI